MNKFVSLYVINKCAKKYENTGLESHKDRKTALYNLKHTLINKWLNEFNIIERHKIKNKDYIYIERGDFSFHIPESELKCDSLRIQKQKRLKNFQKEPINKSNLSERDALEYILQNTGYNANDFLPDNSDPNSKWGYLF